MPEGENREFCQSCLLTGKKEEPVVLRRAVEPDKEMSLNTGGVIDKSLCLEFGDREIHKNVYP